jgi:hypothetical protein
MHRTPEQEMQQQRLAENMRKIKHKIVVMSGKRRSREIDNVGKYCVWTCT